MRTYTAGLALAAVALLLTLPPTVSADIPPPPPPGLKGSPGPRPLPITIAGLAGAFAIALAGLTVSRYRANPIARWVGLAGAAVVLAVAGVAAFRSDQAWKDRAALEASYKKQRASWRSRGPVPRPLDFSHPVTTAGAVLAFDPQGSFPQNIPWAALALNARADGRPR